MPGDDANDLDRAQACLEIAVQAAGEAALRLFRTNPPVTVKKDNSPVCEADYAADAVLKSHLFEQFPGYGWISEESATQVAKPGNRTWIVDPIDGTRAFVNGREDWSVCVALIEDDRPVLAAIFLPCSDDLYEARAGSGAILNKEPLQTSRQSTIDGCRMVGYSSLFQSGKWTEPWPSMKIEMFNSMAIRLALVADGSCDAVLSMNAKSDWDLAAADLLVQEAGGFVTDINGASFRYGRMPMRKQNVLASGARLHSKLLDQTRGWTGKIAPIV